MSEPQDTPPERPLLRWAVVWIVLLAIPLIPFTIMVLVAEQDPFEVMVDAFRDSRAAAAVVFLLLASDVFLPIPSSLVALVSGQAIGVFAGGLLNLVSITLGHVIGFAVARRWGKPAVTRFIGAEAMEKADLAARDGATIGLILSRPVPVLAEALSMYAGLTDYSMRRFLLVITLANIPHSFIYSWAGASVQDAEGLMAVVIAGVAVPTVGYIAYALWRRAARKSSPNSA